MKRKVASFFEILEAIRLYGPLNRKKLEELIGREV